MVELCLALKFVFCIEFYLQHIIYNNLNIEIRKNKHLIQKINID
jgi:hypothetical protein